MSILRYNAHLLTGTCSGVSIGSAVSGNTLFIGQSKRKVTDLSAQLTVLAETNTITLAPKWQGSNDGSTWIDLAYAPNNPAVTVLATGTAGADAAVTKGVAAPDAAYSYKFSRCQVVVGVVTGTSSDIYSIGYSYRQVG